MKRTVSLSQRFGWLGAHATQVHAALLAAHGAATPEVGFRPADVRFFFLLFTNWMEADVLRPGQDVDLTQIRRVLGRLTRAGLAAAIAPSGGRARGRQGYRLTDEGIVEIAEALVEPGEHRPFDETLFVVCFAAAYGDLLTKRLDGRNAGGHAPARQANRRETRRRVTALLDPHRALTVGKRALAALRADLEERVRSSLAIDDAARRAGPRADQEAARFVEELGGYQLQRVRPLGDLLLALPGDVRAFELARGMRLRAELLFAPLAEAVRGEQGILEALGEKLRGLEARCGRSSSDA